MPFGLDVGGPGGLPRNFEAISRGWMADHAQKMADLTNRPATPVSSVSIVSRSQQADLLQAMVNNLTKKLPMDPKAEKMMQAATWAISRALATAIQGQYVPEWQAPGRSGLYLVKPNIERTAQRMDVDPLDLAKYVALHEATHHWQFTANPWLEKHMEDSLSQIMDGAKTGRIDPFAVRRQMAQIQSTMSLVEGHANFMAAKLADAKTRAVHDRFEAARVDKDSSNSSAWMKLVRKAMNMDGKSRQYVEGEKFCEAVFAAGGHALLDKAWTNESTLPSADEMRNPSLWVARMSAPGTGSQAA